MSVSAWLLSLSSLFLSATYNCNNTNASVFLWLQLIFLCPPCPSRLCVLYFFLLSFSFCSSLPLFRFLTAAQRQPALPLTRIEPLILGQQKRGDRQRTRPATVTETGTGTGTGTRTRVGTGTRTGTGTAPRGANCCISCQ